MNNFMTISTKFIIYLEKMVMKISEGEKISNYHGYQQDEVEVSNFSKTQTQASREETED